MSSRLAFVGLGLLCAVGVALSCRFEPDLSRFATCADDDSCSPGFTCLREARRCLPDCGAQGPCLVEEPPDAGPDASVDEDAGTDAGMDLDAGTDAGADAGADAGTEDGGMDASIPLSIVTERLALGIEQTPYTMALQAKGGLPPYQYHPKTPFPGWLALEGGTLSGTPPAPGTFGVAVEVTDTDTPPAQKSASYSLRVRPRLRVAGPAVLTDGYYNNAYSEPVSATGGLPPYRFKIVSGNFPTSLTLSEENGSVTGTPQGSGNVTYNFRVQVTDSDPQEPQVVERDLVLMLSGTPLLSVISTESLPDGRVGTPYQYSLKLTPNSNPVWKLKVGSLPSGVGFFPATATLSGTPNLPGNYTFTINVVDGLLVNLDKQFTVTVY